MCLCKIEKLFLKVISKLFGLFSSHPQVVCEVEYVSAFLSNTVIAFDISLGIRYSPSLQNREWANPQLDPKGPYRHSVVATHFRIQANITIVWKNFSLLPSPQGNIRLLSKCEMQFPEEVLMG